MKKRPLRGTLRARMLRARLLLPLAFAVTAALTLTHHVEVGHTTTSPSSDLTPASSAAVRKHPS